MMVELNVNDEQEIARSGKTTKSSKLANSSGSSEWPVYPCSVGRATE